MGPGWGVTNCVLNSFDLHIQLFLCELQQVYMYGGEGYSLPLLHCPLAKLLIFMPAEKVGKILARKLTWQKNLILNMKGATPTVQNTVFL